MYKILVFVFLVVSCANHKDDNGLKAAPIRVLSEDEKQRLLTPTIYYIPKYTNADHVNCPDREKTDLIDSENNVIVSSCRRVYKSCEMQGSCQVEVPGGAMVLLNVDRRNEEGIRTFDHVNSPKCLYGRGAARDRKTGYKQMCMDPYYSIAADLSIYHLGDVIFIPVLQGLLLPNGEIHNGFVIVRDTGGSIKGYGRFDFFTGFSGLWKSNPFYKLGLGGDNLFPEYYLISGPEAQRVRLSRGFPYLKPSFYNVAKNN